MDLNKIVNEQFAEIVGNGYIEELVKKQLENTVSGIVRDLLREYSDFGNEMKSTIQTKLNINFNELDIPQYNTLILDTLKEHINKLICNEGIDDIKSKAHKLLFNKTEEIKVSELVKEFKNTYQEEANDEGWGEFTCIVEKSSFPDGYFDIFLDKKEGESKYTCQYFIRVNEKGIWHAKSTKADRYKSGKNEWEIGALNDFKEYIFNLYAHGTKILNDEDNIEPYYDDEYDC